METALFLLSNAVLLMSAWLVSSRVLGLRSGADRAAGAFVAGSFLVVASMEILSALSSITFENVIIFHIVLAVLLLAATSRCAGDAKKTATCGNATDAGARVNGPGAGFYVICALFAAVFIIKTTMALTSPPPPTDAFLDHLVFPAQWLKAAHITMVQTLSPDQATTYYPSNAELIYLWLMLPLHDDLATGLLEPMALLVCIAAAARIGKRCGMETRWAMCAALLAALAPGVNDMIRSCGVDLFFAAAALCAAAFLLPDEDGNLTTGEVAAAGLAAGLAAGAKYVGVVTVVLILPLAFAGRTGRGRMINLLIFGAAAAAAGGFWYARNLAVTGSAFYPMGFDLSGIDIMRGAFDRAAMYRAYLHIPVSNLDSLREILSKLIFGPYLLAAIAALFAAAGVRKGTLGAQACILVLTAAVCCMAIFFHGASVFAPWTAVIPAAIAALIVFSIYFIFPDAKWWQVYALSLGPILFIAYWYVNPYNTLNNYRFIAPGVFAICLAAGKALEQRGWRLAWWLTAACAAAANAAECAGLAGFFHDAVRLAGQTAWHTAAFKTALPAAVSVFFILAAFSAVLRCSNRAAIVLSIFAAFFLFASISFKSHLMDVDRYRWYSGHYWHAGWNALAKIQDPVTVAYAGNCSPYALYGNRLKNDVVYINLDGSPDKLFHDYEIEQRGKIPPPESSVGLNYIFRNSADYAAWLAEMARRDVDILFLTREFYRGAVTDPQELTWAMDHPETFKLLTRRDDTFLFAIDKISLNTN